MTHGRGRYCSAELEIDASDRRRQRLTRTLAKRADVVVTMGCGDTCPYIAGKRYVDWTCPTDGRPPYEGEATRHEIATRALGISGGLACKAAAALTAHVARP